MARPASRFTSRRLSLRALDPLSANDQARPYSAIRACTSFSNIGRRCISSTTTQLPFGRARTCWRKESGCRVRSRNVRVRRRSNQSASGRTWRNHVVLPVPRGPNRKNERPGTVYCRVYIPSRISVNLPTVYTYLPPSQKASIHYFDRTGRLARVSGHLDPLADRLLYLVDVGDDADGAARRLGRQGVELRLEDGCERIDLDVFDRLEMATSGVFEIKQWVPGFGPEAKILSPPELQGSIAEDILKMQTVYGRSTPAGERPHLVRRTVARWWGAGPASP